MPPHPLHASYTHVIEAGLRNVRRLTKEQNQQQVFAELDHLAQVTQLLTRYLLYDGSTRFEESEHLDYWYETRTAYIEKADPRSILEMEVAWSFVEGCLQAMEYHWSHPST